MTDKPAAKKTTSSSKTEDQKEASAQNVVTSLPSSTLAGGPSQDDLNPAFAPPKVESDKKS